MGTLLQIGQAALHPVQPFLLSIRNSLVNSSIAPTYPPGRKDTPGSESTKALIGKMRLNLRNDDGWGQRKKSGLGIVEETVLCISGVGAGYYEPLGSPLLVLQQRANTITSVLTL